MVLFPRWRGWQFVKTFKLRTSHLEKWESRQSQQAEPTEPRSQVKLSIVTQFYPPDYAATGQLIAELAAQLGQREVQVEIFTGQPGYAFQQGFAPIEEHLNRLTILRSRTAQLWPRRIRGKAINGLLFCLRAGLHLLSAARRNNIILLTTAPPFLQILGYLIDRLFGLPYICLIYDLYPDIAIELGVIPANSWLAKTWHAINRHIWQRSQQLIVLSATMKQRILEKCPEMKNKISVIHNWANPQWIVPLEKHNNWFAQQHQLNEKFTVLYSGNMGRCHDLETLLLTAQQLQHEPIQFLFIGNGAKHKICTEQTSTLGLKNVRFLPYQDKPTLPYSLTACDLSIVSISPGMEGLVAPSKVYSALAAGRPIAAICERHSYLQTLIANANCGATFESGDSNGLARFIRHLASNRHLAQQMGRAGRQYLQANFTPEIIADRYLKILTHTLR